MGHSRPLHSVWDAPMVPLGCWGCSERGVRVWRVAVVLLQHRGVPPASPVPPSSCPPWPSIALGRKRSSREDRLGLCARPRWARGRGRAELAALGN